MNPPSPRIVAHRGFAGVAPENTLAAFRAVADGRHPADMVELDVVPCADGTPVVFHDSHLDDTGDSRGITDGQGVVWETACETLAETRVLGTDQGIPTLEAALSVLLPTVGVNVELKNPGTFDVRPGQALDPVAVEARRERWDPFLERVRDVLARFEGEVLLSSFHEPALAAARELATGYPVAPLFGTSMADGLHIARRYDCEAIHPSAALVLGEAPGSSGSSDAAAARSDLFATAADLGADVNAWTVRTWREADRLGAAGVDGLIADYPGLRFDDEG